MNREFSIEDRNKRLDWIDVLRGIAIFFVVLGHSIPYEIQFFVYTDAIKMPLFFIISGYLFSLKYDTVTYLKKIFFRLVIPWFVLSLIPYIAKPDRIVDIFIYLIQGKRAWFMLAFTVDSVIVYLVIKTIGRLYVILALSFIIACVGLWLTAIGSPNIMMINTILTTQAYIIVSYFCKVKLSRNMNLSIKKGVILMIIYLIMCFFGYSIFHDTLDVHINHYFNIPFCFALIAVGNTALFVIGQNLFNSPYLKPIAFLGKQSLTVYLLSGFFLARVYPLFNTLAEAVNIHSDVVIKVFGATMCCCVLSVVSYFIGKYLPLLNGEYKGYKKEDNLTI